SARDAAPNMFDWRDPPGTSEWPNGDWEAAQGGHEARGTPSEASDYPECTKLARVDEVFRSDGRLGACVAIVQCAVSVATSSSTGAPSGTAAAVAVVSSHSIGSGLRVIARTSTSSIRETGTMSRPFLMLSLISTRSLAFSSG